MTNNETVYHSPKLTQQPTDQKTLVTGAFSFWGALFLRQCETKSQKACTYMGLATFLFSCWPCWTTDSRSCLKMRVSETGQSLLVHKQVILCWLNGFFVHGWQATTRILGDLLDPGNPKKGQKRTVKMCCLFLFSIHFPNPNLRTNCHVIYSEWAY